MGKWNKAQPELSQSFLENEQRRKQMILDAAKRRKQKERKLQQQAQQTKKSESQALIKHKQQKKDAYIKYLRNNMHDKYEQIKYSEKANQPQVRSKNKWTKNTIDSNSNIKQEKKDSNNLQSLNLQVNIQKGRKSIQNRTYAKEKEQNQNIQTKQNKWKQSANNQQSKSGINNKSNEKRRMLENQFQQMWNQQNPVQQHNKKLEDFDFDMDLQLSVCDDMLSSKLLDSLDLDFDTINRGKQYDKKVKQSFVKQEDKQIHQIKNLIGYESILMSFDERNEIKKKYHQVMVNEVEQPKKKQPIHQNDPIKVPSYEKATHNFKKQKSVQKSKQQTKPLNQGQFFNELRNKKQGKILNWATEQVEQADELFSNCSTNKKSSRVKGTDLLKQINKEIQDKKSSTQATNNVPGNNNIQIRKKQPQLQTIPEKRVTASRQKLRERSFQKRTGQGSANRSHELKRQVSRQKIENVAKSRTNRLDSGSNHNNYQPPQPVKKIPVSDSSKQLINKTANTKSSKQNTNSHPQNDKSRNRANSQRSFSKQKSDNRDNDSRYSKQIVNQPSKPYTPIQDPKNKTTPSLGNLPRKYPPQIPHDEITIATQDQIFQVESFIKNELLSLNKQERQVQQQLRNIHVGSKQRIKQVQQKYDIRTDYKHSKQLQQDYQNDDENSNTSYRNAHKKQTQDELQQSIQRLDDMLLRKQIIQKQKNSRISDQQSQSSRSIINPLCDPIQLHKQVLQLAQNLSRFEGQPQQIDTGYGAKLRMKKNKDRSVEKITKKTTEDLSESQQVNMSELNAKSRTSKFSKPPELDYYQNNYQNSYQNNYKKSINQNHNVSDLLDDELQDSIEKGKIQVNEKLRNILLD